MNMHRVFEAAMRLVNSKHLTTIFSLSQRGIVITMVTWPGTRQTELHCQVSESGVLQVEWGMIQCKQMFPLVKLLLFPFSFKAFGLSMHVQVLCVMNSSFPSYSSHWHSRGKIYKVQFALIESSLQISASSSVWCFLSSLMFVWSQLNIRQRERVKNNKHLRDKSDTVNASGDFIIPYDNSLSWSPEAW